MPLLHVIALVALALFTGFVGGCVKGGYDDAGERGRLTEQVRAASASVEACGASLAAMQQQALDERARADKAADDGRRALDDLVRENLSLADQLDLVEGQLASARLDMTCRQQLEVELCASVPLL